jgi:membrane-associated phospholipid phosphatase
MLFWIILALNSLVVASTLPEGGHYLVDVIAGILVAGVSIIIVAAVEARSGERQACGRASDEGLL